jgi:hypothetical protein
MFIPVFSLVKQIKAFRSPPFLLIILFLFEYLLMFVYERECSTEVVFAVCVVIYVIIRNLQSKLILLDFP